MIEWIEIRELLVFGPILNSHPLSQETIHFDSVDIEDPSERCSCLHSS